MEKKKNVKSLVKCPCQDISIYCSQKEESNKESFYYTTFWLLPPSLDAARPSSQ